MPCSFLLYIYQLNDLVVADAVDAESESTASESLSAKETIDIKEVKRVDHILASLLRKVDFVTIMFISLANRIRKRIIHKSEIL